MVKKREPSPHVYPLPSAPFLKFYRNLPEDSVLKEIIGEALDALKENRLAGIAVEKKKIPRTYTRKYGINSGLYKMNLRGNYRLTYVLITVSEGICPHIIEVMTHSGYDKRFGYRRR